jgi:endoribonuclease LACTB2
MNVREIEDGQSFDTPSPSSDGSTAAPFTLTAVHTPGHTADHLSFLITSSPDPSEPGALFTGDNVLGHGTAVFEDLATYLSSLRLMSSRIGTTARAYPAHGAVIEDGKGKIEGYIAHREQREREALSILKTGRVGVGVDGPSEGHQREWASMEIVKIIYKDMPEELHKPAEGGLLQVLSKLEGEGRVRRVGVKWRIVNSEKKTSS